MSYIIFTGCRYIVPHETECILWQKQPQLTDYITLAFQWYIVEI